MRSSFAAPAAPAPPGARRGQRAAAFFDEVHRAYLAAEAAAGGSIDVSLSVGGEVIRLCFAGAALVPALTPALGHLLTVPAERPCLTVCIWDSRSSGVAMPRPPRRLQIYGAGGEIVGFRQGPVRAAVQLDSGTLSFIDGERQLAVYWVKDAAQLPLQERGTPLSGILQRWAIERGMYLVHAAAVGLADGGVLLPGAPGSGKSNVALACLQSDLSYAADDLCLVAPRPRPAVLSLYSSGKAHTADVQHLPFLRGAAANGGHPESEKDLFLLAQQRPQKLAAGFPLRAIVLPRLMGGRRTRLTPAPATEAMRALLPSTTLFAASSARRTFRALAEVVRCLPCYRLELGADRSQAPEVILALLSERS